MTGAEGGVEIALLDRIGVIESVNQAWTDFCLANGGDLRRTGIGVSYLDACNGAGDDDGARQVQAAIESALAGQLVAPIVVQIPCDSPTEPRWFDVLVSSRFDPADRRCVGASVTISRSRASRRPIDPETGVGARSGPAFPDLPRMELEQLVADLVERSTDLALAYERLRSGTQRRQRWSTATIDACRAVLADGGARPLDVVVGSLVASGVGGFAFVAGLAPDVMTIVASSWPADGPVPDNLDVAVAEPALRGASAMLTVDALIAITPLLTGVAGTAALAVGARPAETPFDSVDLDELTRFAFHVATAMRLAAARSTG